MSKGTPLDRRGFMRIAGRYGFTSTALAVAGMVGPLTLEGVGRAAAATSDARSGKAMRTWSSAAITPASAHAIMVAAKGVTCSRASCAW